VTLRVGAGQSLVRTTLQELLDSGRARPIIEGPVPASDDTDDDERVRYCNAIADTAQMNERELAEVQALVEAFERGEFRYVD
jgi:hypothetical protein